MVRVCPVIAVCVGETENSLEREEAFLFGELAENHITFVFCTKLLKFHGPVEGLEIWRKP